MAILSDDAPFSDSISHQAHLEHKLRLEATEKFVCDGCHEHGAGERYRCHECNFDLHKQCALDEGTKLVHPLLRNIELELRFQAPGSEDAGLVCDACTDVMLGFHYHSSKLFLHPCCVNPPEKEKEKGEEEKEKETEEEKVKENKEEDDLGRGQRSGTGSTFVRICTGMVEVAVPITYMAITGDVISGTFGLVSSFRRLFTSSSSHEKN